MGKGGDGGGKGEAYIDVRWDKGEKRWMMQRWDGRWVAQRNWVTDGL